jgi:hypothetical protein
MSQSAINMTANKVRNDRKLGRGQFTGVRVAGTQPGSK